MRIPERLLALPALALVAVLSACERAETPSPEQAPAAPAPGVVDVMARDFAFEAPAEIPSGWTTFRLHNAGAQEHFMVLWKMPEGRTVDDYATDVVSAFDSIMGPYMSGSIDRTGALTELGGLLPEWFGGVRAAGGVGLVAPGRIGQTAVKLEPGHYVMECYVRTPDGIFHSSLGMLRALTVTEDVSDAVPPEADVAIALTNYEITIEGELAAGPHTVGVAIVEDPEGLLPHSLHLARLGEGGVDALVPWMDWMDGLQAPAPAEFLGGAEKMPAANTEYVTVELEPGSYAWISEAYAGRGMVAEFTVE